MRDGVLAFDFGFRMGFAYVKADAVPQSGSFSIEGSNEDLGPAGRSLDGIARQLILKFRPAVLTYASPWFNPRKSILEDIRPIIGWRMVLEMIADELKIECCEVNETEARDAFMGFVPQGRKNIKNAVMATCRHRGWPCKDEDAADATCIGCHMLSIHEPHNAHRLMPLFQPAPKKRRAKHAPV